jgi:hypothetical protein
LDLLAGRGVAECAERGSARDASFLKHEKNGQKGLKLETCFPSVNPTLLIVGALKRI